MGQSSSQETFICFSSPILLCLSVCRSRDILCRAESFCLILESSVWTQEKRRRKQSKPRINNCSYGRQAGVRRKRGLTVCRHSGRTGLQRHPELPQRWEGTVGTRPAAAMHSAEIRPGKLPGRLGVVQRLVLCSLSKEGLFPQNGFFFASLFLFLLGSVVTEGWCLGWRSSVHTHCGSLNALQCHLVPEGLSEYEQMHLSGWSFLTYTVSVFHFTPCLGLL